MNRVKNVASLFSVAAAALACGSSSSTSTAPGAGGNATTIERLTYTASAAVTGAVDAHCAVDGGAAMTQAVDQAECHLDGSVGDPDTPDYGTTMYGASGHDDDCKYDVSWQSNVITENADVYFRVVATVSAASDAPLTGATPIIEAYLDDNHPAPNTNQAPIEETPGTYFVGPIHFDEAGKWTVRFHFFEQCSDVSPSSPHGHAAFFVSVP